MVQFQRNSVYRYDDSKKSEAEKSETEWMEKEKIKIQDKDIKKTGPVEHLSSCGQGSPRPPVSPRGSSRGGGVVTISIDMKPHPHAAKRQGEEERSRLKLSQVHALSSRLTEAT
ncbi:hypothetical protein LSTR_LSTR008643 [Laodelphax striatellus]|uniref:Uncharacterized protein n=1 Tax=Laodelphax striatellus TaxID=195883 RepID=A0A482WMB5_LAOST|nr:hypothetical protein LSTR_LSTR008643 [Laodelphax striatellus]